jgi:carboxymethylenebutenolidase
MPVTVSTVTVATEAGQLPVYEAVPDTTPRGGVVVIQEAFGVNSHIEDVTRRFAAEGYLAVAPHLFHRSGDPVLGYDDFTQVVPHMQALTRAQILQDVDAALDRLAAAGLPAERVGIVGFCMGGTVSLIVGAERPLGAAVSFYGGGVLEGRFGAPPLVEVAPGLQTPWLGLYGDEDGGIPVEQIEQLRAAAQQAAVPTELVRYPGAKHGFHCDQRSDYDEASARDAWRRTLDFFADRLGG